MNDEKVFGSQRIRKSTQCCRGGIEGSLFRLKKMQTKEECVLTLVSKVVDLQNDRILAYKQFERCVKHVVDDDDIK